MTEILKDQALFFLRKALNNPHANFREGQWEAITNLIKNRSQLLVVQRTGWGKSLVYFLATRLLRNQNAGPTLLISPLLALIRNQQVAAERIGLKAASINSENYQQWDNIQKQVLSGQVDLLLISPERLGNESFRANILSPLSQKIGLFVVDEAHCISDWGHDFRPDYRRIVTILQALPKTIPVLATTATANNRVVNDIKTQLGENLHILRGSLTRPSLKLQNIHLGNPATRLAWLAETIPNLPGNGIIYTLTIKDSERVANWLNHQGIIAQAYHGRREEREVLENQLLENKIKALVATTALGMGFDKPDLGFVIHYQRPGSIVHYYQQVGRAGRAVEEAYGILLCGDEDDEITHYFIETAFPPQAHTQLVLNALNQSENGLSIPELEQYCNLSRGKIDKVLKFLSFEFPSPVVQHQQKWYATSINYQQDYRRIKLLNQIRQQEQAQIKNYMNSRSCLMEFLTKALDDSSTQPCGKCAICLGRPLFPETVSLARVNQAIQYLKRSHLMIEPRKQWPSQGALPTYNFSGNIQPNLRAQIGRALCLWGDGGWGELVKIGKYQKDYFDDPLVQGIIEMIQQWQPQPKPTWITCVPSLNRPQLVPNFAQRLAEKLGLPFLPVVKKIRPTQPQKTMSNSYQQAYNLDGAFQIDVNQIQSGALFLVDDFVDSRWTLTIITALLRQAGSGQVFPLALTLNSFS